MSLVVVAAVLLVVGDGLFIPPLFCWSKFLVLGMRWKKNAK